MDRHILLVEDDPGDARLTRLLLEESGAGDQPQVLWVQTAEAAIKTLKSNLNCEAVLLDLGLPDGNGLDALRALSALAPACPIVVLTGDDSESTGLAAVAAGAQDFLLKGSFDAGLLRRCLRFAAHRKRVERGLVERAVAAQAAMVDSANRLADALARIADGFMALDAAGCFTYVNARAVQLLGKASEDELLGHHIWTEFPRALGTPLQQAYETAVATGLPSSCAGHFLTTRRWLDGRLYPSADGMSIYFTDVSERVKAEQALQLSEQKYRLASAHGQVWDWDLNEGRVTFPAAFWRQLGMEPPPAEETSARFDSLLHPDDADRWRLALEAHLQQRVVYHLEYRARHANGEWRWFETQGQAVWNADGRAAYMAGTTFEITARKQAELGLRESEAYRRSLFEQLADGVLLADRAGRILDANPRAHAMLGYGREELLRLSLHDILPHFERHRLATEVAGMLSGTSHLAAWEHQRKDGTRFAAEVSAQALDAQRFLAIVRDVTVRRESEKALLEAQLELSQLAQRLLMQEKLTTQRVAQSLHDRLGQTLAVARLKLDAFVSVHHVAMTPPLKEHAAQVGELLDQAVHEVRQVLVDLRPPLLEDQGLGAALDNEIRARAPAGRGPDVLLEEAEAIDGIRWPEEVEYAAFMVAREAIANAQQHAGASLVRVLLEGGAGRLNLHVIDDGVGVPAALIRGRPGHLGIVGMRERAIAIDARFVVSAEAAGGTRVTLSWEAAAPPLPQRGAASPASPPLR